jgi:hypothetical protein
MRHWASGEAGNGTLSDADVTFNDDDGPSLVARLTPTAAEVASARPATKPMIGVRRERFDGRWVMVSVVMEVM